ncbi:hypothetical protein O3G_MSEX012388 [Manduca sexta]|uniref:Uncharacterized protein n=2 Tax=Manduca sexta TaxID=7130 RepID=A0A922CWL3_MANSE|nr:hypothetical protein O3G_MSEX012388 [Manduca sexta]
MNSYNCDAPASKAKNKKSKLYSELNYDQNLSKRRTKSVYENFGSFYSTSSYHSIIDPKMAYVHKGDGNERQTRNHRRDYIEIEPFHLKDKKIRNHVTDTYKEENRIRSRKIKHNRELDQEFIADIIRRQYKPVKMFGRKESDLSQFSAPVCRDQDYLIPEDTRGTDLCSCCYEGRRTRPKKHKELTDMRSICDTRLYSSKRQPRSKQHRRLVEVYNDSDLYDLVPVKEKSSPKSRKKFAEDNLMAYSYYKEVPPSPRTHRPRLNLKAQYFAEFEDFLAQKRQNRRNSPTRSKRSPRRSAAFESDTSEMPANFNQFNQKQKFIHSNRIQVQTQNTGTASSLHSPKYGNEIVPETALNKTQETDLSIDKTDKALSEIKDILQSFLLEIKKETTASQCDKSDVTSKVAANDLSHPHNSANAKANMFPQSGHSFNYTAPCNMAPCMPAFPNPCCYPVLPICPMNPLNCMQNGYTAPTPSFTCATCANKDPPQEEKPSKSANNTTEFCNAETEELIKEIYKYVAQSPRLKRHNQQSDRREKDKLLTSRSVGGSAKGSRRDANVGTPKMKCYSKSCEAISTRLISDTYYSGTNASYSDTLLEKLSVEATPSDSISETDFTTESTSVEKGKQNKFAKVLRSFGLMKKKKKDVIEELSESESAIDVEIKPKPPFKQKITNYMMHGQEYYHPPPVPPMHHYHPEEYHEHRPYLPRVAEFSPHEGEHTQRMHPHVHNQVPYHPPPMPLAPPYSQAYDNYKQQMQQNVPLCLKEIEVKSIGTQSERKMSFFRKMKTKIQPPGLSVRSEDMPIKNCSTQTQNAQNKPQLPQMKPGLFNWKNLQKPPTKMDPMAFSFMKQKQLAEGDFKIRDAMVKKLFYKRNPFSPRNLLVRTILGKDKSSYGDPPTMYRPRMFF